jgi:dihydroorotate dehydrogenase (fumarate)
VGAAAIVLHSLFEEQIRRERMEVAHHLDFGTDSYAEALSYFPEPEIFHMGTQTYLEHIQKAKALVDVPIIASLNGSTLGGWVDYARQIQAAGADALELNIYWIPTDLNVSGADVEQQYLDILKGVVAAVTIPVAVKLSPYFSNLAHMATQLCAQGAEGLVLFNRFYEPDIDIERLEVRSDLVLSGPSDFRLPPQLDCHSLWSGGCQLAATTGINAAEDVIKMVMAGADVTPAGGHPAASGHRPPQGH